MAKEDNMPLVTTTEMFKKAYEGGYAVGAFNAVSYTHLRAHETDQYLVCRLLLEKKKT